MSKEGCEFNPHLGLLHVFPPVSDVCTAFRAETVYWINKVNLFDSVRYISVFLVFGPAGNRHLDLPALYRCDLNETRESQDRDVPDSDRVHQSKIITKQNQTGIFVNKMIFIC